MSHNHDPKVQKISKTFDQILEKSGYKLHATIGNGSYAKVKEVEYISKNGERRKFAAKIIDRRKAPADFLNKFLPRELEIYLKLDHPNIVRIYEIMEIYHRIYIIMELAEGGDLLDFIKKRGALPNNLAKRMFNELAHAIKYIHGLQITHRDLKCENILLDKNYHVKLADFGFGRSCVDSETGKRILSRTYCGSAAYAAPEILQGTPYNPKLYDIWSLGCILYIMVCGCMPFDDTDIKKMIKVQLESRIKFSSKTDPIVKDLINQMLEPDVTRRTNIDKVLRHLWLRDFN
ncbi:testis-specific serine threonine- kinase 1 [Brachionus plicatilis]|uniref:Testis-specific serine threonine-kinase 1 n=1 Tax=Brachionus plicatilis TaxID=10195 RepID=A0A3M7PV90_BRAPC|nr:testis-specific serine threonine- kinase 1 [Brachionus plicatilis]